MPRPENRARGPWLRASRRARPSSRRARSRRSTSSSHAGPTATRRADSPRFMYLCSLALCLAAPSGACRRSSERKTRILKATTKALIAAAVAVAASVGLIIWQAKHGGWAHSANLTAADMSLIAEGQPPQVRAQLASDPERRKEMAQNMRELLALSEEARARGVADRPEIKRQLELTREFVLFQTYVQKQREAGEQPNQLAPEEEVKAYLAEPGTEQKFEQLIADLKKLNPDAPSEISEAQKQNVRQQWATAQVIARKAVAAGADKEPKTQLQVRLQQARLLAAVYSEELMKKAEPTDQEIE